MKLYAVYGIGERSLVVKGTLIAVQINKFYEKSKNAQIRKITRGLLIENLIKDSIYIVK